MKKGFTLIELLAVITLLGLLSLIVVPIVDKLIKDSEEDLYNTQVNNIEIAAKNWAAENVFELPESGYIDKTICDLENAGFLELDIKNPKTDDLFYKDSYVRITKTDYGYEYKYVEEGSSLICTICNAVTDETKTAGNVPNGEYNLGDEYICEVGPDMKYHFFIVSTEDDKVNLLMDSNINKLGKLVNNDNVADKGLVAWITKDDYLTAGGIEEDWLKSQFGYGDYGNSTKGPITTINYLNDATKNWDYISKINTTYVDSRYEIELNGKARLLNAAESSCLFNSAGSCPSWMITNLDSLSIDPSDSTKYLGEEGKVYGYWTLATHDSSDVYDVNYTGTDINFNYYVNGQQKTADGVAMDYFCGVRPVITVTKSNMSN